MDSSYDFVALNQTLDELGTTIVAFEARGEIGGTEERIKVTGTDEAMQQVAAFFGVAPLVMSSIVCDQCWERAADRVVSQADLSYGLCDICLVSG